jgi:UDP-N-acetylmuramate-alanine ligase
MTETLQQMLRNLEQAAQVVLDELLDEIENPIEIKNHAHFKRILQEGKVKLETLALARGFNALPPSVQEGRLYVGMVRHIKKADTTGVYLAAEGDESRGSFLGYDKAKDWVFDGNIATNTKFGYSYKLLRG